MFVPQRVEDAVAVLVHEARDVVVHLARVVRNPELVGGARGAIEAVILGECVLELGVKEGRREKDCSMAGWMSLLTALHLVSISAGSSTM